MGQQETKRNKAPRDEALLVGRYSRHNGWQRWLIDRFCYTTREVLYVAVSSAFFFPSALCPFLGVSRPYPRVGVARFAL